MVWGIVFSYLEGRQNLRNFLGVAFMFPVYSVLSGAVKIGWSLFVMEIGQVSQFLECQSVTGAIFLFLLCFCLVLKLNAATYNWRTRSLERNGIPMNRKG